MVALTIRTVDPTINVKLIHASMGKAARAEPIQAKYAPVGVDGRPFPGIIHHVGFFPELEDEMCSYVPGAKSPNRLDAHVYALSELMLEEPSYGIVGWD
jgi:phage terminase large subunit-like protein